MGHIRGSGMKTPAIPFFAMAKAGGASESFPTLYSPISEDELEEEALEWAESLGIGCGVYISSDLGRQHAKNRRRYAEARIPHDSSRGPSMGFAPQAVYLPRCYRAGLIIHEIGHILSPRSGEDGADRAGARAFDDLIEYDPFWPGKGLQYSMNASLHGPDEDISINGKPVPVRMRDMGDVIYIKHGCPYCHKAMLILSKMGIDPHVVDVARSNDEFSHTIRNMGMTVPQIFIDGEYVGGCDDLVRSIGGAR
jgi:glutaredoxin 3